MRTTDRADRFDKVIGLVERGWLAPSREWVTSRASGRVLEIGVGTGLNLPHYDDDVTLTAVDVDADMLAGARRRAAELGLDVEFHHTDGLALPFDDASFDTIVATFVLCEVANVRRSVVEMMRVLRPGGKLLLADHVRSTNPIIHSGQWLLERVTGPLVGEWWTRRPSAKLKSMGVNVLEQRRRRAGIIEDVHAVKAEARP